MRRAKRADRSAARPNGAGAGDATVPATMVRRCRHGAIAGVMASRWSRLDPSAIHIPCYLVTDCPAMRSPSDPAEVEAITYQHEPETVTA